MATQTRKRMGTVSRYMAGSALIALMLVFPLRMDRAQMLVSEYSLGTAQAQIREPVTEKPVYTAAVWAKFPPQYDLDEMGNPAGFAIDILEWVAEHSGFRVEYLVVQNGVQIQEALKSGRADLIPNMGITPGRAADFDYTLPVETFRVSLFTRTASTDINGVEDLKGHKVAVVETNVAQRILKQRAGVHLTVYRDMEPALLALLSGAVDAFAFPEPLVKNLARQIGVQHRIKVVGAPLREIKRAMAVRKGNTALLERLDAGVAALIASKDYQRIYAKWYGRDDNALPLETVLYAVGGLLGVVVLLMSGWRYVSVTGLNRRLTEEVAVRRKSEQALRESERDLARAQEITHLGRWEWHPSTGRMLWSDEICRILGRTAQECIPSHAAFMQAVHPDNRKTVQALLENAPGEDTPCRLEFRMERLDGTLRTVQASCEAFRNGEGEVRVYGTLLDITEQKRTEESLLKNEARLKHAQQIARLGYWELELPSQRFQCSDEMTRTLGCQCELCHCNLEGFLQTVHPDDRERVRNAIHVALYEDIPFSLEHRIVRPDGSERVVDERGELVRDEKGFPVRILGTLLDITERRQTEVEVTRFKTTLDLTLDSVFMFRPDTLRFFYANQGGLNQLGYTREEMLELTPVDIKPHFDEPGFRRLLEPLLTGERASMTLETEHQRKDGTHIPVEVSLQHIAPPGEEPRFVAIVRDIGERRHAEEQLREQQNLLRTVFDVLPLPLFVTDREGHLLMSNRDLDTGKGTHDAFQLAGLFAEDPRVPERKRKACMALNRRVLNDGEPGEVRELGLKVDGETRYYHLVRVPLRDASGRVTGMVGINEDITGRKRAELLLKRHNVELERQVSRRTAELQEERNFIAAVLDTEEALVVVLDRAGRIVRFNRACEALTGYTTAEVHHRLVGELFFNEEEREAALAVFSALTAGQFPNTHENHWVTRDGVQRLIAWSNSAILDERGQVEYVIATGIDITEQKAAVDALRRSEERYRSLVETMDEGVAVRNEEGRLTFVNRALLRMLGYTGEALIGQPFALLLDEAYRHLLEDPTQRPASGDHASHELELRRADGSVVPALASPTTLLDSQGAYQGTLCVLTDISALKATQQALIETRNRLRYLLDSSPAVIYASRPEGDFAPTFVSENVATILGYDPQQLLREPGFWKQLIHPNDLQGVLAGKEALLATGQHIHEYRLRDSTGEYCWVHDEMRLIWDEQGRPAEVIGFWIDVTERIQAEADLCKVQEELLSKEKLATLGQLTATVSHELRNPLGTIRTSLFTALDRTRNKGLGVERPLERIERNVTRCDNIITDLLDYSRTSKASLEPTPIDPWIKELLSEQIRPGWLEVHLELGVGGREFSIDPDRFRRAVINVYENAVQAMQVERKTHAKDQVWRLTLATRSAGGRLEIAVTDTGPGMPPEVRERIFEPLFSTKNFGVGLGLPTVKQIMEQHQGGIDIVTEPGNGTTVVLWLPVDEHGEEVSAA